MMRTVSSLRSVKTTRTRPRRIGPMGDEAFLHLAVLGVVDLQEVRLGREEPLGFLEADAVLRDVLALLFRVPFEPPEKPDDEKSRCRTDRVGARSGPTRSATRDGFGLIVLRQHPEIPEERRGANPGWRHAEWS